MPSLTANTFFSPSIIVAESIAGLRLVDIQLADKNPAIVAGSTSIFDGSAWLYLYDADNTSADNGSTILKPASVDASDPGRWRRLPI